MQPRTEKEWVNKREIEREGARESETEKVQDGRAAHSLGQLKACGLF